MSRGYFSLVEVLVAVMLLAIMGSAATSSYLGAYKSSKYAGENRNGRFIVTTIVSLIQKDLQQMVAAQGDEEVLHTDNFNGDSFRADSLQWLTLSEGVHGVSNGATCEVGYICSPSDTEETFSLYRREQFPADSDVSAGGSYRLISDQVNHFAVKYLENGEWLDAPTRIPNAVSVELGVGSREGEWESRLYSMIIPTNNRSVEQ